MSRIQSPKGTYDILPLNLIENKWQSTQAWQAIEEILHKCSSQWGFQNLRLPLFESTDLFHKSTGDSSDIVQKEMYTFKDKGNRSLTLRPEGTPGTLRALIDAQAFAHNQIQKLYYLGPMFRYERPQQGRYRQFHQFGAEMLGPRVACFDADVICLGWQILQALGLNQCILKINTLANEISRKLYKQKLKEFLEDYRLQLSEDSQRRLELNPLRILDSKEASDQELLKKAPTIEHFIDNESKEFFAKVLTLLQGAAIPYHLEPKLVRGLDYYCDTVFEFQLPVHGSHATIGGGGRYGQLLASMGGPALEGVGFAFGMERLLQGALTYGNLALANPTCDVLLISLGATCFERCFTLTQNLRKDGLYAELWPFDDPKKLKNGLSYADKIRSRFVAILGEDELITGKIQLRCMDSRKQSLVLIDQLKTFIKN